MLDCFLDLGGQVVDTARVYGYPQIGASEAALGKWFSASGRRNDVVLLSKGGHPPVMHMHQSRMSMQEMTSDLTASLQALRTDYIDVYFYHRDDETRPVGELLEQMEAFRRQGKIRYYACSNWTSQRMQQADAYAAEHGLRGFIGSECMYNAGCPSAKALPDDTMLRADAAMLAHHRSSACVMIPYSGLCNGFFHQLIQPKGLDQLKLRRSMFYTEANVRNAARIRQLMAKYNATVSQVLIGYFFTLGMPVLPLIGCRTEAHLADMMQSLALEFSAQDFADFE